MAANFNMPTLAVVDLLTYLLYLDHNCATGSATTEIC